MPKFLLTVILIATGCAGTGGLTVFTDPPTYMRNFDLGKSQQQLLAELGAPDNQTELDNQSAWVYIVGDGLAKRRYTFIFSDGKVSDVHYTDNGGPHHGKSALALQQN